MTKRSTADRHRTFRGDDERDSAKLNSVPSSSVDRTSLDVRGAGNAVCIVAPANLRDEEACAGLDLPTTSAAETAAPGVTVRARGISRSWGPSRRTLGFLQVMAAESAEVWPDEASAAAFSSFFLNDMSKDLPATEKARVSASRIETSRATRVVRFVIDVDGLAPGSALQTTRTVLVSFIAVDIVVFAVILIWRRRAKRRA